MIILILHHWTSRFLCVIKKTTMKKLFTLAIISLAVFVLKAQQPANAGFENWTVQNLYNEPNGYLSTNSWVYQAIGVGNVSQDPGSYHASYAARLTTVKTPNDTI